MVDFRIKKLKPKTSTKKYKLFIPNDQGRKQCRGVEITSIFLKTYIILYCTSTRIDNCRQIHKFQEICF